MKMSNIEGNHIVLLDKMREYKKYCYIHLEQY